jgi:hypothetical protein
VNLISEFNMQNQAGQQNATKHPDLEPVADRAKSAQSQEQVDVILCNHCLRTARNGIKCQGICVADSNY